MLNAKVADLLNDQVNKEFYSAYLYLEMNNYFLRRNLDGFANWFHVQAMEEQDHAMLFYQYLHNEEAAVTLKPLAQPTCNCKCDSDVLQEALNHEQFVTASIHSICDAAMQVNDYRTLQFLEWFVKEQAEEEVNARDLVDRHKLFASDAQSLYLLDSELAKRTYKAPSLSFE